MQVVVGEDRLDAGRRFSVRVPMRTTAMSLPGMAFCLASSAP